MSAPNSPEDLLVTSSPARGPFAGTPIRFRLYYALVVACGIWYAVWAFPSIEVTSWTVIAWWLLFALLTELSPILLPGSSAYITVSSALDYAAIVLFGPAIAAAVSTVVTLFTGLVKNRQPAHKVLFNACLFIVTIAVSGAVFELAGGYATANVGELILPMAACGATYFLFDTFGVSVIVGFLQRVSIWRVWQRTYLWTTVTHLAGFVPLGAIMVVIFVHIGVTGVALFLVPLLLARYSFKLYMDMRNTHFDTVRALTSAIDASDPFTRGHSERVTAYAVAMARRLGLAERRVVAIEYASLLHDMGKIAVQHDILLKPGKLSEEEWSLMRMHPETGAKIVSDLHFLKGAREVVLYHHERYDGLGYPDGLKGCEIPLEARNVKVADAFDAMLSDRPYRKGLSVDEAVAEVEAGRGTEFDPKVVDVFLDLIRQGEVDTSHSPL